jgi:UDP-N-acetylglucosamine 2-epimerase (non-hydrolysing)
LLSFWHLIVRKSKVLIVFGTRPEAIKLAPVVRALETHPSISPVVCVTGQHRQMLDAVLETFAIRPDFDLDVMQPKQALADVAARILQGLDRVFARVAPDFTLVQGDTTTCFAGALASFYRGVPVGHVEAGLRTWNIAAPFPEEGHRAMVSRIAALHFAPTREAARNLLREGILPTTVHVTGNTVIDALKFARERVATLTRRELEPVLGERLHTRLADPKVPVVLITGHRRENLGGNLGGVANVVRNLAAKHPGWCFVYLLHPNPDARLAPTSILGDIENVFLVEPLAYLPFIWLASRASLLLTDSGGLQEEASELGKPLLIMREVTERPEAVERGGAVLVGTDGPRISRAVEQAMAAPPRSHDGTHLYGDGRSAARIIGILRSAIEGKQRPQIDQPPPVRAARADRAREREVAASEALR